MAEISDAVQIAELVGSGVVGMGSIFVKTTELGIKILKTILAKIELEKTRNLVGEVSLDKLSRYESGKLSVCRFENIGIEDIRPVLDQYRVPYVVMPEAEVNGIKYTQIAFGKSYTDRVAAVLQTLGGKGEIIKESTQAPYINQGEVSLSVLQDQDGMQLMVCRFPDEKIADVYTALDSYGIKYAKLADLNVKDGCFEIAFPPSQQMMVQSMLSRINYGSIISFDDYTQNADPEQVNLLADDFERLHPDPGNLEIERDAYSKTFKITGKMGSLLYRTPDPDDDPLIVVNSTYAIPVPQNMIAVNEESKTFEVNLDLSKEYTLILPDGKPTKEKKSGEEIFKDISDSIAITAQQLIKQQRHSIEKGRDIHERSRKL